MTSQLTTKTGTVKWAQRVAVFFAFGLLFFPLLHDIKPVFHEEAPYGVAQVENRLRFSLGTFLSGKYQKKAGELAKKQSGLWRPFTLIGNQLLLWGFNQITAFHNDSVFMGDAGQLVQTIHLSAYNRTSDPSIFAQKTTDKLKKLKTLQEYQAARGKSVIAVLSPNVTEIYPETVPKAYRSSTRDKRESSYEQMKKRLDEFGITYIDGPQILKDNKDKYPFRMFGHMASHWNDVASCLVLKQVNDAFHAKGTAAFPDFKCEPWKLEMPPRGKDLDLLRIANLLFPKAMYEPMPYVEVPPHPHYVSAKRPEVTLSGTSYLFAFAEAMKKYQLTSNHVHYFYYRQRRTKDMKGFGPLRKQAMDWKQILDRDITIVDAPMRQPSVIGYGFVEDAVKYINAQSKKKQS